MKIPLYKGRGDDRKVIECALVDDCDYEELSKFEWGYMELYHCDTTIKYARRYTFDNGKTKAILMHRVILGLVDGSIKCDHKDGNGINNQRCNLRQSTHSQNMSNRTKKCSSNSKYIGISKVSKNTWSVSSKHNGVIHKLFGFKSEKEAALAYNYIAFNLKGEFAKLNDIYI